MVAIGGLAVAGHHVLHLSESAPGAVGQNRAPARAGTGRAMDWSQLALGQARLHDAQAVAATRHARHGRSHHHRAAAEHRSRAAPRHQRPAAPAPPVTPAAPAAPAAPATPAPPATGRRCGGGSGLLPENYAAIVGFLTSHGYTGLAAAGIAGNIYQESRGNPESVGSGGGGLIGWTPLPAGYVTGSPAVDLQTQLNAVLSYNQGFGQYIPALNAATSATEASDIYMNDFVRPGYPAAATREAAANAVAAACGL